jgi:uncharacterized protein (TIGR02246 family)
MLAITPTDIPKLFAQSWNDNRADQLASLFEEDADFINVVGIWWQNREDIFHAHDYGLKVIFQEATLSVGKVKVKTLSPDIAIVHARMRLSGQTSFKDKAGIRQNLLTFVVRQHTDHWLCVSAQNTDIVIGAETYVRDANGLLHPVNYRSH